MFFFCLRNINSYPVEPLPDKYGNLSRFDLGEYHCTLLTDEFYSHLVSKEKLLCLYESLSPIEDIPTKNEQVLKTLSDDSLVLSYVVCDVYNREIYISRKLSAGRPFYYYISSQKDLLCCSSHIRILRDAGVPIAENRDILPEFLSYSFVMPPNFLLKDIMKIEAGEQIKLSFHKTSIEIDASLKYMPPPDTRRKLAERSAAINHSSTGNEEIGLLAQQISRILEDDILRVSKRTDCKLIMPLSGGLDSSVLAKIALEHELISETFSTGYPFVDGHENMEKNYATTAAEAFGTQHRYYETTTQNYLKSFIFSIYECEEPHQYLQSGLFHLFFREGLPKGGLLLSGQGADGIFGLPIHYKLHTKYGSIANAFSPSFARKALKRLVGLTGRCETLYRFSEGKMNPLSSDSIIWTINQNANESWICEHFGVTRDHIVKNRLRIMDRYREFDLFDQITIINLLGNVVSKSSWSKLAEVAGNKIFYPYMRKNLVDFCLSIPWALKLSEPKFILRYLARNLRIPEFIVSRPKSGLAVDRMIWAAPGGIFEPFLSICKDDFDLKELRKLQTGDLNSAWTFWNILNYSIWKSIIVKGNHPSDLLDALLTDKGGTA